MLEAERLSCEAIVEVVPGEPHASAPAPWFRRLLRPILRLRLRDKAGS